MILRDCPLIFLLVSVPPERAAAPPASPRAEACLPRGVPHVPRLHLCCRDPRGRRGGFPGSGVRPPSDAMTPLSCFLSTRLSIKLSRAFFEILSVRVIISQVLGSPCANIFVTPNGDTTLISTHERIFVAPHRAIGSTFPQHSVPHAALAEAVLSIGNRRLRHEDI